MRIEPQNIAISKSKGIRIDWNDGHHSEYTLGYLRDECPCATCTGAHGTVPQKSNYAAEEAKPANPFKMYTPTLKMLKVEEVGAYAIQIQWSDGHSSGIYSFDHLRKICNCRDCKPAPVETVH